MASGMHHYHKRRRVSVEGKKDSGDRLMNLIDKLIYFVAVLGPLVSVPQIWKIWVERNAAGVSVFTWCAFVVGAIIWLFYGFIHKEKPIIVANILWIIMEVLVIVGAVVYG